MGGDDRTQRRSFVIARHKRHGYLLLRSEKPKKGTHYQLPGGHVDFYEAKFYGWENATAAAALRELHEETGLDFSAEKNRLHRIMFPANVQARLGQRYFYEVRLRDDDSLHLKGCLDGLEASKTGENNFYLRLSSEHTGFAFEPDLHKAAEALQYHSGGKCSRALLATQSVYSPDNCCLLGVWRYLMGY
mmetsp:Transcript_60769/g.113626  ORF Transcript_60769/g.113626 Transcript_60769/m.113626 type:complete len:189 (-) Transcript_60769:73-639(-)